jgi:hypothetical protein
LRRLTEALSVLERKVFLMTMPARPPALRILMKCWRKRNAVSPVRMGKFCCTSLRSLPPKGGLARMMSKRSFSCTSARFSASVLVWMMLGASMPCRIMFMIAMT